MSLLEDTATGNAPSPRPPSDLIRALRRGLAILNYVARAPAPVSPREVATELELNISTTYHLLNTLLYDGYLVRDPATGTLSLGAAVADMRNAARESPESVAVRRVLGRGAHAAEDSIVMAVPYHGRALVIASETVPGADSAGQCQVGSMHLLHGSAVGQVMLAMAPRSDTAALLEQSAELAELTGKRYQHEKVVRAIEQIRARGVSFMLGERNACIGVPVRDALGNPVGAVAVVINPRRLRQDPKAFARIAHRTAQVMTRELARLGIDARSAIAERLGN